LLEEEDEREGTPTKGTHHSGKERLRKMFSGLPGVHSH